MEDAFRHVKGVVATTVGYSGGSTSNPTYGAVCSGTTGHTEVVEVKFDPSVVSYEQLLKVFWSVHDPTADLARYHGGQYKSVIFYHDAEQQATARNAIEAEQKSGKYFRTLSTQLLPEPKFWRAEEYHQQYYEKNKLGGVCSR